uniref:Importin-13 n=1 Tax=Oncorhynchus tshawytscha TaxID=74940 RepID=A0AAZ3SUK2_ONCTS
IYGMEPPDSSVQSPDLVSLELTVENVEKALQQLYYDPDMEHKNVAQKWLTQAQTSRQAWQFCWPLLSPDKLPEIQFFGASTLHTKISCHWADLPTDQHQTLRMQLLSHISHFSSGPKMVLTRLCVALASLALHTMPQGWPRAVADMVRVYQPEKEEVNAHAHCLALLELLTVLPEEFQSCRLPQARRAQLREALAGEWTAVCPLLRQLLQRQEGNSQVKERALRCLSSWVGLDVPLHGESEGLLQDCFAALSDPELFDTAVETIVSSISQPDCQRTLLEQVEHWQGYLALVNMILFCTGIPGHYPVNETTSSLTLTFWYTLQDDILSFEEDKQVVYLQVYRPVYFQLVDVLLHKAHFPSEQDYTSWSSDDKEQFRIYRVDISDTLMYVYEILGAELLSNLYDRLGRLLMDTERPTAWQDTEALLFGFQAIAETIDVNYSDVIPGLIGLIPRISISNIQLADTVMYTIGSLAEWLADHPMMLGNVLPMVLQGLVKAELSVSSVSTLKRICRECRHDLAPYIHDIMTVSQVSVTIRFTNSQCMWLMQGLGFLLSALPMEEILGSLTTLLTPHIQRLDTLAHQEPSPTAKLSIIHILGMLSSLFTTLDISRQDEGSEGTTPAQARPNPVVVVLQQVFTLIQTILSKWLSDSEVVEAVCGVFERSVKTLLNDFAPMVQQLSEMLGQIYSAFPQASALDLTRQMVHIFAGEKDHFSPIQALIELVTSTTLSIFQQGKRNQCSPLGFLLQLPLPLCHHQIVGSQSLCCLTEHFSEVLFCLNRHCPVLLAQWLKEGLRVPGFPSAQVSMEQKDTFSQQLLREQTNKRRVKEIVKEFSLLCRGMQGTTGYSADY